MVCSAWRYLFCFEYCGFGDTSLVVILSGHHSVAAYLGQSKQEAHLCQRDRAMLRIIEYFAMSLKVIRYDTLEKGVSPC